MKSETRSLITRQAGNSKSVQRGLTASARRVATTPQSATASGQGASSATASGQAGEAASSGQGATVQFRFPWDVLKEQKERKELEELKEELKKEKAQKEQEVGILTSAKSPRYPPTSK